MLQGRVCFGACEWRTSHSSLEPLIPDNVVCLTMFQDCLGNKPAPFMCHHSRTDFGIAGYAEPEETLTLIELILTEGFLFDGFDVFAVMCFMVCPRLNQQFDVALRFLSNSAIPGTERIAVTAPDSAFMDSEYKGLPLLHGSALKVNMIASFCIVIKIYCTWNQIRALGGPVESVVKQCVEAICWAHSVWLM